MPNRNYQAGVRWERKRKKHWESKGFIVYRTAGSHGSADLILVNKDFSFTTGLSGVYLVQCKVCATKKQAERLLTKFEKETKDMEAAYQILEIWAKDTKELMTTLI